MIFAAHFGLNSFPRLRVILAFFRIRLAWFRCVLSLVIHLWRTSDVAAPSGFLKNAQDLVRVFSGVYVMVCFLLGNCGSLKEFCFTKDVDNFLIAHYHCQKRVKERKVNRNLCAPVKPRSKRDWLLWLLRFQYQPIISYTLCKVTLSDKRIWAYSGVLGVEVEY